MRIPTLALGLLCAAGLFGQSKVNWQNNCFNNPGLPYCQGRDFAIPKTPAATNTGTQNGVTKSFPSPTPRRAASSMTVVGGIDWRFADPFPDALIGFNISGLAASPLARDLIAQLGASPSGPNQGLTDADIKKIFDGLAGVDQVAMSVRNNRVVVMVTGRVADSSLPAPEAGLKAVSVSGSAMLFGHSEAVDQAVQRMSMKGIPTESARLAEQRQASSEFWAVGSPALAGPQAVRAGVKRFSLTVSIRDRLISDVAFEFNGVPTANTLKTWQPTLGGGATLEGNVVHLRTSMEAGEVQQKFGEIAASSIGQRLAELVKSAQYLPAPATTAPKRTRPVIYGLDDGPREVR